jgi:hypothetical protein
MADMERRLSTATTDPAEYMGTPLSHAGTSFLHPLGPGAENAYLSPPLITDGPLKTLNSFQNDDPVETESHDPILQSTLTEGEAHVMFRL